MYDRNLEHSVMAATPCNSTLNTRSNKMAQHLQLTPVKTYATAENAHKAVEKKFPTSREQKAFGPLRYIVMQHDDGRFFPVFVGINACHYGVHFHFNVIA